MHIIPSWTSVPVSRLGQHHVVKIGKIVHEMKFRIVEVHAMAVPCRSV
jgi:hypothetical protein